MQNELFNLLDHEHLSEAAILIMANKQDLKDAMTVKEMSDVLALHTIKRHDWHIQVLFSISQCHLLTNLLRNCCCRNPSHLEKVPKVIIGLRVSRSPRRTARLGRPPVQRLGRGSWKVWNG